MFHDNGFDLEVDGVRRTSLYGRGHVVDTLSIPWTSELNRYYSVWIRYQDAGGPGGLQFNWTYQEQTCNGEIVPAYSGIINEASWYSDMTVLGSAPYNITVTCPDGYGQDSTTGKCAEIPGNGYRTGSEV